MESLAQRSEGGAEISNFVSIILDFFLEEAWLIL
jgi:hypothetical protein